MKRNAGIRNTHAGFFILIYVHSNTPFLIKEPEKRLLRPVCCFHFSGCLFCIFLNDIKHFLQSVCDLSLSFYDLRHVVEDRLSHPV